MNRRLHIVLLTAIVVSMTAAGGVARAQEPPGLPGQGQPEQQPERPKVAVVLSGGGAKGVAHIGALRVLEQAGIPVDIVVGTSMGAIVGGMYSIGYTTGQLDSMVMSQDWSLLLSDRTPRNQQPFSEKENDDRYQVSYPFGRSVDGPGGLIKGTNLEMLFNDMTVGHHDNIDFRTLPIPFACVAANIVDGSTVVFERGVLSEAMRASMAIPGVFTPVYMGDMVLVDGGITNNFPTDVAREMGAEVIIGVDVQSTLRSKDELVGATSVLRQIVDMTMQQSGYRRNISLADVYIKVDVEGYSSSSFNLPALDSLIDRGGESALGHWDELMRLKRRIGLPEDYRRPERKPFKPLTDRGTFRVINISFDQLTERQRRWVMRKCRIRENSNMTIARLNHCISVLGAATSHTGAYYSLRDTLDGYNLDFHMDAVRGNTVSAGVNFDTEEIASVLVNATFRLGGQNVPMEASVTGRFGKRLAIEADYVFRATPLSGLRFGYTFNHNDININEGGIRSYNTTFNRHLGSMSFVNMNFLRQNLRMELGAAYERYNRLNLLSYYRNYEDGTVDRASQADAAQRPAYPNRPDFLPTEDLNLRLWSYFARIDYETLDSRYFARRGTALSIDFDLYTDNFYQWMGHAPFSALSVSWTTAIPITQRFSLVPSVYGRFLMGDDVPFPLINVVGGKHFGRYLPHQMPFDGISYMETAHHTFIAGRIQGSQRIGRRHYVSGSFNYGVGAQEMINIPSEGVNYFGASLDYGYDLRGFPLQASISWSNISRIPSLYLQAGYMF